MNKKHRPPYTARLRVFLCDDLKAILFHVEHLNGVLWFFIGFDNELWIESGIFPFFRP